ncbi:DUF6055 domain-containing protein [Pseudoxanthomonas sp. UTMC 1351]|uniref:DUF6055 domain-containing protein n=1 Tax=Pseudoxanthomonas sp. UTMC 1351 TaxID=2695853 RepID=UPI0034CDC960
MMHIQRLSFLFRRRTHYLLCGLSSLCLLLAAGQVHAGFGTCANPTYLQRFDERLRNYDCVASAQYPLATPEGRRRLRILHHRDPTVAATSLNQAARGLRAAIAALGRVGRYSIYDVSILLVHDVPPPDEDTLAIANGVARTGEATAECQITLYLGAAGPDEIAPTVAHEIFHCVQAATYSPGQNKTYQEGRGGTWWIEGSAEWFASLALPDASQYQDQADDFAFAIQRKPLYRHDYESLVFFLWLAQREGPERVMWFLAGMPQNPAQAAQRQALRDAISDSQWMRFALDLADGNIRRPHGPPFRATLALETRWTWDRDRSERLLLPPFTVAARVAEVACGVWDTQIAPQRMYVSRRPRQRGDWAPLPPQIDTSLDGDSHYLIVAANADDTTADRRFGVRQASGCAQCGGITEIDACLVGSWRESGGGAAQWLRENMPAAARLRLERGAAPTLTLQRDGMYLTSEITASLSIQPDGSRTRAEGDVRAQASGRWSAADGRLHLCSDLQAFSGEIRLVAPSQTVRGALPASPPGEGFMRYTCRGNSLETIMPIPRPDGAGELPPMRTSYTRVH